MKVEDHNEILESMLSLQLRLIVLSQLYIIEWQLRCVDIVFPILIILVGGCIY